MDPRQQGYSHQHRQLQHVQNSQRQHQRFSWQSPPSTPPEETQSSQQAPQQAQPQHQHQQQPQQQQHQQPQQHQVTTNVNAHHDRHFSYTQTPVDHRNPDDRSQPPLPPLSPHHPNVHGLQYPSIPAQQTRFQPQALPQQPASPPPAYPSSHPTSPAFPPSSTPVPQAPAAQTAPIQTNVPQQASHGRQRSNLSPINTAIASYNPPAVPAGPLPHKGPMTPVSPSPTKKAYLEPGQATSPTTGPINEPYTPHGFERTPVHQVFSPHSTHGPNGLDFALHQPGQIAHPNMELSKEGSSRTWKHNLFSCVPSAADCFTGLLCPCILYGRTSYRLNQKSAKKDPTDLLSHKTPNGHCMLMSAACGLWWLFPMLQRTRIRHTYKLEGSCMGDLARACCCCCCVAVQNEREVREREEGFRRWAGPSQGAGVDVYARSGGMVYQPQN